MLPAKPPETPANAAVAVDQHQAAKSVSDEVAQKIAEQIEIGPRRSRERAGEVEMMLRVSQPHQRGEQRPIAEGRRRPPHDFSQEEAIGEERHVMAVLFEGRDGKNDRHVLGKRGHVGPMQIGKLHERKTGDWRTEGESAVQS